MLWHLTEKKKSNDKSGEKKSKKGKKNSNDSSDESVSEPVDAETLGLPGDIKLSLEGLQNKGNRGSRKLKVTLHKHIHTKDGNTMLLVMLDSLYKVYWLKAEHVKEMCALAHKGTNPDKPTPPWINSLTDIHIRGDEHGKLDKYWRAPNGKGLRTRIAFAIVVPREKAGTLQTLANEHLDFMSKLFLKRNGK